MSSTREPFAQKVAARRDAPLRLHTADEEAPEILNPRYYQALRTARRPHRLNIRCHTQPARSLPYAALLDILSSPRCNSLFTLVFHHLVVHVSGRNLTPLVAAIGDHVAAVIEEYHPELFDTPGDGEPAIEGVEVEAGKAMEELAGRIERYP